MFVGFEQNAQGFLPGVPVYCRDYCDLCMKKSDIILQGSLAVCLRTVLFLRV
jgi:hypothetical protein